ERRLAAARGTDHGEELSGSDVEVHAVERDDGLRARIDLAHGPAGDRGRPGDFARRHPKENIATSLSSPVILSPSPFPVILSAAKDLLSSLRAAASRSGQAPRRICSGAYHRRRSRSFVA